MEKRINFLEKPENIRLRGKTPDYWCKIDKDNNYGDYTLEWWSRDYAPVLGKAEYGSGEKSFKDVAIGLEALGFHMRITTLQDTRYEDSDGIGDWDVMDGIGVEVTKSKHAIVIADEKYLIFKKVGELPEIVIDTWVEIGEYFENNSEFTRAFTIDFEHYTKENEIEIYISIEK